MELLVKLAWLLIAGVHAAPAAVLFAPGLVERLYGISPDGDVGLLVVHRGALFLAVVAVSLFALIDPRARGAAALVAGISMAGFLFVYVRAGMPEGPLRTIALADAIALVPFALVLWDVLRGRAPGA